MTFLLRALCHCIFHHYIHYWCDFTSCWIWANHHFSLCSLLHHYPRFCFWFIILISPLIIFLQRPLFPVWHFLCIILTHLVTKSFFFIASLLILYSHWAHLGPWLTSFSIHVAFYTWGHGFFYHWVFGPSFPSFLLPYHPSLRYVPCFKTTLRSWDQMSFSIAPTWTGV